MEYIILAAIVILIAFFMIKKLIKIAIIVALIYFACIYFFGFNLFKLFL